MGTLTTKIEIENPSEETLFPHTLEAYGDTPRSGDGDETTDPKKPEPNNSEEEDEGEVRPGSF
ncbi:hypothetical protein IMCC3317_20650 [Kordia antarctica]|uniref:Uncharacterized protein n=1 Tax=Kordia antarctica TaxID=1218801 RepID=A0A7L4ZJI3_9FLAO|nr:hypothetical protein [Kordia antarctica]QHI36700.1 hypothetical protein IMCC3317_20650 [Kordia antarctica]